MSQPKLISPLLDNFLMGDPFSDHHGVRCCPAMKKDTEEKYIVKIISVPASQVQLDALLLTGAYPDKDAAATYFKEVADGVVDETLTLQKLSQLEGFVPYEAYQVVEMDDGTGYDIYLLSSYKKSLEHVFRKSVMTHLGALNLGLDICAALAVSRRSGYLYADLKPDNIFVFNDKEFRIGDLGFLSLDSLKYTSLPDKYRSSYTAPEIQDAYSALNTTLDIYAVGMILYQVYNNGVLPVVAEGEQLPPPAYGDFEISEIILKACAPNPEDRWQDPVQMGQALVSYMQRNGANDTPIVPVPSADDAQTDISSDEDNETGAFLESEVADDASDETTEDIEETAEVTGEAAQEEIIEETLSEEQVEAPHAEEEVIVSEDMIFAEDDQGNLTFLDDSTEGDDPVQSTDEEETSPVDYDEVSEEVTQMLNQADELIAHDAPDPVVAPEPIEISVPDPIPLDDDAVAEAESEPESEEDSEEINDTQADEAEDIVEELSEESESETSPEETDGSDSAPAKSSHWVRNLIIVLVIAGLLVAGWLFYRNYYLQPVSITLEDSDGILIVHVDSKIDESKLAVTCSDTYGIRHTEPVVDGKAVFEELTPNSAYTVEVTIDGFHQLIGKPSTGYTTPTQTNIVQMNAVTGPEDGSVIIGFTIDGPDSQQWTVQYVADGEDVKEAVFTGHMVTINGLTVGADYDFTLVPNDDILITGNNQLTFTAAKIVCATDLKITGFSEGALSVAWSCPEDATVDSWTVRCYNDKGYDKSVITEELTASFADIVHTDGYTIEVTASGMSVYQRTQVTDNSINITNLAVLPSDPGTLHLDWDSSVEIDAAGWTVQYSVNSGETQEIAGIMENSVIIPAVVPEGVYEFTILAGNGCTVFNGSIQCTAPAAQEFAAFGITADDMDFYMCRTPDVSPWDEDDLTGFSYVTDFNAGEKASFLIRLQDETELIEDPLNVLFVVKDEAGTTLSSMSTDYVWSDFWNNDTATLDLPWVPDTAGSYWVGVYFNGMLAFDINFNIL